MDFGGLRSCGEERVEFVSSLLVLEVGCDSVF